MKTDKKAALRTNKKPHSFELTECSCLPEELSSMDTNSIPRPNNKIDIFGQIFYNITQPF